MKKNEIALLILILAISLTVAYFVGQAVLGSQGERTAEVQKIEQITSEVAEPEARTFNDRAVNPTVEAEIGNPSGDQPLGTQGNQ